MNLLTSLTTLRFAPTMTADAFVHNDVDSIQEDPAHHKVVLENDQVRVVRWVIPVGDKTRNHSHPDNLSIALTDYNGKVTTPDGKAREVHLKAGSVSWREGGKHLVENIGKEPMEGILIEPRRPASVRPAGSADPVEVDPKHEKVEFENERIRVLRERQTATFPKHGHPDNVQVLLTDLNAILTTPDGKSQTVTGKAGDVRWRSATQHEGEIVGGKPAEQIVVEMKGGPGRSAGTK